jgi:beta-lactamase regulating signal transducer with metallopeptidase domain
MSGRAEMLVWALLRTGLLVSFSAVVVLGLLRWLRVSSPTVRRAACFAVLVQGWLFIRWTAELPVPGFVQTSGWDTLGPRAPNYLASDESSGPSGPIGRPTTESRPSGLLAAETGPPAGVRQTGAAGSGMVFREVSDQETAYRSTVHTAIPAHFPWALSLVAVWGVGLVVVAGRSAWLYARFVRGLPRAQAADLVRVDEWDAEWIAVQRQAGLRRLARLLVVEEGGPMLCRLPSGYRLIVPRARWQTLEAAQRVLILRHELAHILRRDVWKSLGMRLLALPHWFNPLVWRIVGEFDECAEWACDEAAGRAAPECVPEYARALLQLVDRAEPAVFATRAARASGIAQRIRRLLQPANEKGSNMKKIAIAAVILAITLVGLTQLQFRSKERPLPFGAVSTFVAKEPPVTDRLDVVAAETVPRTRQAVTVMVPRTTIEMVPVTKTRMVPETRVVEVAEQAVPGGANQVPVAAETFVPRGDTLAPTRNPQVMVQAERVAGRAAGARRLARVNLGYVQQRMDEFQREKTRVMAEIQRLNKEREAARAQMLTTAQARINGEKDPVMKEIIDKGMTKKFMEMIDEENAENVRVSTEVSQRVRRKIVDEVARYAKENHILVVRREPGAGRGAAFRRIRGVDASWEPAPLDGEKADQGREVWEAPERFQPRAGEKRRAGEGPFGNDDVLYSDDETNPREVDISDAIVDRLNQADAARKGAVRQEG